jgi:AcrR family transcriptional regulator
MVTRLITAERVEQLIRSATDLFIADGYRRAQMEDVAQALGVAKGTLYGYVDGKATLFDACVRCADGHEPLPEPGKLPLQAPKQGTTVASVQARLLKEVGDLELLAALARDAPRDPAEELREIISDLYTRMSRNRFGIKLVDRCAKDQPELAAVWFGQGRSGQNLALARYFELRAADGLLRRMPSAQVAARTVLETVAFWAVHRHWDPSPQPVDEASVQAAVVDQLLHGLIQEPS